MLKIKFIVVFLLASLLTVEAQTAKRVVSLAPSITKNLYLLGAQDKLVGRTSYCITKKEDNIPVVGSAVKVNIEKMYTLKPDLVITTGLTSPETIGMLKKLGIKYKVFESPKNFEGICYQFIEIAKLVGREKDAKKIIAKEKAKLSQLQKKLPKGKKPKIFIELGAKPLFTVIPNTFMHDYITFIGGENIASNVKTGIISRETILLKNPDYIFVTTMGNISTKEIKVWNNFSKLSAAQKKQIYALDSNTACTPCPDSFTKTVATMVKLMYGI